MKICVTYEEIAAALMRGGWTSADCWELQSEYGFNMDDLSEIVMYMEFFEDDF